MQNLVAIGILGQGVYREGNQLLGEVNHMIGSFKMVTLSANQI